MADSFGPSTASPLPPTDARPEARPETRRRIRPLRGIKADGPADDNNVIMPFFGSLGKSADRILDTSHRPLSDQGAFPVDHAGFEPIGRPKLPVAKTASDLPVSDDDSEEVLITAIDAKSEEEINTECDDGFDSLDDCDDENEEEDSESPPQEDEDAGASDEDVEQLVLKPIRKFISRKDAHTGSWKNRKFTSQHQGYCGPEVIKTAWLGEEETDELVLYPKKKVVRRKPEALIAAHRAQMRMKYASDANTTA